MLFHGFFGLTTARVHTYELGTNNIQDTDLFQRQLIVSRGIIVVVVSSSSSSSSSSK